MDILEFDEYRRSLAEAIEKQQPMLHGWKMHLSYGTGSYCWTKEVDDDFTREVFATPYWESHQDIAIEYENMPDGDLRYESLPFKMTLNQEADIKNYLDVMNDYLETFE